MQKNYFASLEFGPLYIIVLVVSLNKDKYDVIAREILPCDGFNEGNIINPSKFVESLNKMKSKIAHDYNIDIDEAIIVLPNNGHTRYAAELERDVMTENRIIQKEVINGLMDSFANAKVPTTEQIIDICPVSYMLDDNQIYRTAPYGRQSSKVRMKTNLHTIPKNTYYMISDCLKSVGIKILGSYLNCLAGAFAVTKQFEMESACIHINFNQESTNVSIYQHSLLNKSSLINFGIKNIIDYLSKQLNVSFYQAEEIFNSYYVGNVEKASDIIIDNENNISEKRVSAIVYNRLYNSSIGEILDLSFRLADECGVPRNCKYIVTGFLNNFEYFNETLSNYAELPMEKGMVNVLGIDDQALVNCYGAIKLFINQKQDFIIERLETNLKNDISSVANFSDVDNILNRNTNNASSNSKFKDVWDD